MTNPLANDWAIKHRSDVCTATQRPFEPGEYFYTLLFRDAEGFRREDLTEQAWATRNENIQPFSFWRSKFEPAPAAPPEPLAKENAEQLFRRLVSSKNPPANACYVLAVMLERKRLLKVKEQLVRDGQRIFIYEQPQTGDLFTIVDPGLQLNQLDAVQRDVAALLEHGLNPPVPQAPAAPGEPATATAQIQTSTEPETPREAPDSITSP